MQVSNYLSVPYIRLLSGFTWLVLHLLFRSIQLVSPPLLTSDTAFTSLKSQLLLTLKSNQLHFSRMWLSLALLFKVLPGTLLTPGVTQSDTLELHTAELISSQKVGEPLTIQRTIQYRSFLFTHLHTHPHTHIYKIFQSPAGIIWFYPNEFTLIKI